MATSPPACWGRLDDDALLAARAIADVMRRPLRELAPEAARERLAARPMPSACATSTFRESPGRRRHRPAETSPSQTRRR